MRLVLVDDWVSVRDTWRLLFQVTAADRYEIVGEAGDGEEAVECILRVVPDCVVLDLQLTGLNGFEVMDAVRQRLPGMRFLIVSSHCTAWTACLLRRFQVAGFMDKETDRIWVLGEALDAISAGGTFFSAQFRSVTAQMQYEGCPLERLLSRRELDLLQFIAEAMSNEEIAERTGLAASTVDTHRKHILRKLCVPNTPNLIKFTYEVGFAQLISPRAKMRGTPLC